MIAAVIVSSLMCALLPMCANTASAEPAGIVIAVEGKAEVTAGGATRDLRLKDAVSLGDRVRTAPGARVKLFFESSEVMTTIDEDSSVEISEYHSKGEGGLFKGAFSLTRGRIRMDVERIFGKSIEVRTPNAIAGTKGTIFVVGVAREVTSLFVLEGTVSFTNAQGSLLVEGNHWSSVRGASPPEPPQPMSPEMRRENQIAMRARGSVAAATLLSNGRSRTRDENDTLRQVSTLAKDPQNEVMSQTGAIIKPGSLSITASGPSAPPAPPAPPARPPGPSKPSGQHNGGGGGPF